MAERFTGQRCQSCQGGLIYIKAEKYWECPYCGTIYERELRFNKVQIDGLAGINDLVRSTLSKLISLDFAGADKDLSECEKIDHASVGTLIAQISTALFKSFYSKDRQNELGKVNSLLPKLNRDFPSIDEPEEILYDFIDSADIYALLVVVYSMTGQIERRQAVTNLLSFEDIFNPNVSKYLLNIMLKEGKTEEADVLLGNVVPANCRFALLNVLTLYPGTDKKVVHVDKMLSKINAEADLSKIFDSYFESNNDDNHVVVDIFLSAVSHKVSFDTVKIINSVLQNCDDTEVAQKTFAAISAKRFDEQTANAMLNWAILNCHSPAVSEISFKALFDGNSVFEITDNDIIRLLESEQDEQIKHIKLSQMLSIYKISGKNLDRVLAYHMLENIGTCEYRNQIFSLIIDCVVSIPLSVIESYVLKTDFDLENKAECLRISFEKVRTAGIAAGVFSQYLKTNIDSPEIREKVISVFLENKLSPDPDAMGYYLLNKAELHSDLLLDRFDSMACKASSDTFDSYLASIDPKAYNLKIAALATKYSFRLSAKSFQRYLFYISEPESRKVANVKRYYTVCTGNLDSITLSFNAAGTGLIGNIAQAYFFTSCDDMYVVQEIVKMFQKDKIKLDAPVELASDRKKVKIKKFIESNLSRLDTKIQTLAKQLL